ncbi:hypothetical protein GYN08_10375 [Saccharibacillus sp. VR-M41]|uniref:Uncharacterized protein n=1 Tax=Saccharibacillus alkalitolerans TaxID=2705290 RepID=A0ABX0F6V1_9BACL|nr:hypothetical protein [Saccharibacillus alkalitolerans]
MDFKLVTCTHIGAYGQALTKGKVYQAVAEEAERLRIIGDHQKRVWIEKYYFAEGEVEVPVLSGWKFDDPLEDFDLIEVTVTFNNGMKRWCLITTPERLVKHFEQLHLEPPGFNIRHLIIVRTMNDEDIEQTLKYLDEQGEIEKATLFLE